MIPNYCLMFFILSPFASIIYLFTIYVSSASALQLDQLKTVIPLVGEVTLQKCPWATFSDESVELPSHFLDEEFSNHNQSIIFQFVNGEPQCGKSGRIEYSEHLGFVITKTSLNQTATNDSKSQSFEDNDGNYTVEYPHENDLGGISTHHSEIRFNTKGVLTAEFGLDKLYREIGDYCIQDASENLIVSVCNNVCEERPCIPKCCLRHEVIDFMNTTDPQDCSPSGFHKWSPKFHQSHEPSSTFLTESEHQVIKPHIFYRPLECETAGFTHEAMSSDLMEFVETLEDLQLQDFRMLRNGTIIIKEKVSEGTAAFWTSLPKGRYCIDGIQNYGKGELFSGNSFKETVIFLCINDNAISPEDIEKSEQMDDIKIFVYWVTIPFASIFLILTIIVYILVWNIHNIHGHTLFSYVCSLFVFYIFLFFSHVFTHGTTACAIAGGGIHLFFLITACWLTTINYDVWWTFRNLKAGRPSQNLKRYLGYASFSFGVPICIVVISVVLNNQYKDDEASSPIIIPNYGKDVCALSNASVGYYLYTPIGILIGCNIIFFLWTIGILLHYQRSISSALKGSTNTKEDQSLSVFLKLFVVMGISWIFEIIGWAAQKVDNTNVGLSWTIAVLDVINVLLAVAIFFIFVWKPAIYEQLWRRYPTLRPLLTLCIFGGCCSTPPDNQRPSFSAQTMSTLGRAGTIGGRKPSSGSVNELIENPRKLSTNSRTSSLGVVSTMSTLSETEEDNLESTTNV